MLRYLKNVDCQKYSIFLLGYFVTLNLWQWSEIWLNWNRSDSLPEGQSGRIRSVRTRFTFDLAVFETFLWTWINLFFSLDRRLLFCMDFFSSLFPKAQHGKTLQRHFTLWWRRVGAVSRLCHLTVKYSNAVNSWRATLLSSKNHKPCPTWASKYFNTLLVLIKWD